MYIKCMWNAHWMYLEIKQLGDRSHSSTTCSASTLLTLTDLKPFVLCLLESLMICTTVYSFLLCTVSSCQKIYRKPFFSVPTLLKFKDTRNSCKAPCQNSNVHSRYESTKKYSHVSPFNSHIETSSSHYIALGLQQPMYTEKWVNVFVLIKRQPSLHTARIRCRKLQSWVMAVWYKDTLHFFFGKTWTCTLTKYTSMNIKWCFLLFLACSRLHRLHSLLRLFRLLVSLRLSLFRCTSLTNCLVLATSFAACRWDNGSLFNCSSSQGIQ